MEDRKNMTTMRYFSPTKLTKIKVKCDMSRVIEKKKKQNSNILLEPKIVTTF